jgi:predicted N-acetyltransferase YhbS
VIISFRIEKLRRSHAVENFDCGRDVLNRFLIRFALTNQQAQASQSYVALAGDEVVVVGEVRYDDAPERLIKGLARHPIPVMVLARLAVATSHQGQSIGAGLLRDAVLRTLQAADIAGIRALVVHAKDDGARRFYEHFDFAPSPTDPLHLFVLVKDLRRIVSA